MQFTLVAQIESAFEAEILKEALEDAKIPFIINSHRETAHAGLFLEQRGWGRLLAPPAKHPEALSLIKQVRTVVPEDSIVTEEDSP